MIQHDLEKIDSAVPKTSLKSKYSANLMDSGFSA